MKLIRDYPAEIEERARESAANADELTQVRTRLKDAEMKAASDVIAARGEDNKPLYTNDKARELAVWKHLADTPSYQQDLSTERILERTRSGV